METNEEIQEKRRHVREIEAKLNSTIRESASKADELTELERIHQADREAHTARLAEAQGREEEKSKQVGELSAQLALL